MSNPVFIDLSRSKFDPTIMFPYDKDTDERDRTSSFWIFNGKAFPLVDESGLPDEHLPFAMDWAADVFGFNEPYDYKKHDQYENALLDHIWERGGIRLGYVTFGKEKPYLFLDLKWNYYSKRNLESLLFSMPEDVLKKLDYYLAFYGAKWENKMKYRELFDYIENNPVNSSVGTPVKTLKSTGGFKMIGYSSHGVKTSLAVIKDLELERGNQWFDDTNLDLDKTLAIWVTKRPEDALKYVFPSGIEDMKWTEPEKQLYIQAKKNPESFVEPVDLDGFTEALDDGQGGFLFIKPVFRVTEAPIDMKVDLEIPMEQPEIGKMVKPKSMITYLGGKKKWITVFEEDLIPLLNAKIKRNYALLDVFGGSGIVGYTFAMSDARNRLKKLYYNDLNGHTVNMLKQIKSHPDKMLELHKVIYEQFTKDPTGAGFEMLKEVSDNHKDPVIRAVAFILRQRVSYMGKGDNIPKLDSTIDQTLNKSFTAMDGMDDWHEAFRTAEIWNKEFDVAIADFESKEPSPRVIFCDPPYLGHKSSDQYAAGFDHGLHDRLVDLIRNRKSTYVLTHSITPEFQEVYGPILKDRDWHEDVYVRYGNRGDNERQHETLSVWFSR